MAKLNKQEISAIAADIYEKINTPINEYNELISNEGAYKAWEEDFDKTTEAKTLVQHFETIEKINKLLSKYKYIQYGSEYDVRASFNCSIKQIKNFLFKKSINIIPNSGDINLIERDLIIAQAKNTDVDAMIASVLEKYK